MSTASPFQSGTLVEARGREWVVLPEFNAELLMLRPVGGLDEEVTGVLPEIESRGVRNFSPKVVRKMVCKNAEGGGRMWKVKRAFDFFGGD